jgi:hypothetical protein
LTLPIKLLSVEVGLKMLSAALKGYRAANLDEVKVLRFRCVILGLEIYKPLSAECAGF